MAPQFCPERQNAPDSLFQKNELSETLPLLPGKSNLDLNGEIKIDRTIRKGFELNAMN